MVMLTLLLKSDNLLALETTSSLVLSLIVVILLLFATNFLAMLVLGDWVGDCFSSRAGFAWLEDSLVTLVFKEFFYYSFFLLTTWTADT